VHAGLSIYRGSPACTSNARCWCQNSLPSTISPWVAVLLVPLASKQSHCPQLQFWVGSNPIAPNSNFGTCVRLVETVCFAGEGDNGFLCSRPGHWVQGRCVSKRVGGELEEVPFLIATGSPIVRVQVLVDIWGCETNRDAPCIGGEGEGDGDQAGPGDRCFPQGAEVTFAVASSCEAKRIQVYTVMSSLLLPCCECWHCLPFWSMTVYPGRGPRCD
jgi:hypothetical protein